jgi:hypothetical protein
MMAESISVPKGQPMLDMDGRTAAAFSFCLGLCALATGIDLWKIFTAAPVSLQISWPTLFLLLIASWFALKVKFRAARFAVGLLVLSSGSRVLLAGMHASTAVQVVNAGTMAVVYAVIMAGLSVWIVFRFEPRIRRS